MAKKIRLDMDALAVESYVTDEQPGARGTVRGHLPETHPNVCAHTADLHCTAGGGFCTRADLCFLTTQEHRCDVSFSGDTGSGTA